MNLLLIEKQDFKQTGYRKVRFYGYTAFGGFANEKIIDFARNSKAYDIVQVSRTSLNLVKYSDNSDLWVVRDGKIGLLHIDVFGNYGERDKHTFVKVGRATRLNLALGSAIEKGGK